MKTKLIALTWRGKVSLDPRFSANMLPWTINDIRARDSYHKLSVGIQDGLLEAYNADFELQFSHQLKYIVGMCRIIPRNDKGDMTLIKLHTNGMKTDQNLMEFKGPFNGLVYLLKDPLDPLLYIYLYECENIDEMTELMYQMRDSAQTLGGSVGNIPETFVSTGSANSDSSIHKTLKLHGLQATPASNLKLSEAVRNAHHDSSPNPVSSKMTGSKSYTHGLSNSAGTVHIPTSTSLNAELSLFSDISPNNFQFFEVMYVGKIRVSHKRVPFTFIDDALPKFKAYDMQKTRLFQSDLIKKSEENLATPSKEKEIDNVPNQNNMSNVSELRIFEDNTNNQRDIAENTAKDVLNDSKKEKILPQRNLQKRLQRGNSQTALTVEKNDDIAQPLCTPKSTDTIPKQRDRSASIGAIPQVEQNRTMVFLVGRTDLRLISPDRKQVLLYKEFKDVSSCAQGQQNADHFGIICREVNNDGYISYVFKCQSDHVADDIVASISQAFINCSEQRNKEKNQIFSCEHCPMLWYHKLCSDIEGLNERKTQAMIFRRIEQLTDDEQDLIYAKYYGAEKINSQNIGEQNQFLMMLLRAHCESRQQRHIHDTAENRSEFLNQYLGGSTIFMKAKRSLTSSFDHLLKRKGSKDDISQAMSRDSQIKDCIYESMENGVENANIPRPRANTIGSSPSRQNAEQLKSPMIDIFFKVGNSPKENTNHQGSWRQAILHRVVTPSKHLNSTHEVEFFSSIRQIQSQPGNRSKAELRELWKTAIRQTILLSRMEKENARLLARQSENELKKIKLDYDEILPCDKQAVERWEIIIEKDSIKISNKKDPKVLLQAIKNGIPRTKRGEVWSFLAEQYSMNTAPIDTKRFPNFNTPYNVLLKNLTEHQHAIFIDLGRTFPNHKYYKAALGVGQLSLFNLLKAYSILDPELGYCQGLGFICGILLLHCEENEAFQLLKHLMFRRQMRLKYLPDMKKFQLQLYQLSRLVKDHLPDLYDWLDQNDVSPTLYAAPWILTIFSSQFSLGFVARVFDLLFLESSEVIFKFAMALLTIHKDEILVKENFEDIMDYLKTIVPKVDANNLEKIIKLVSTLEISQQLSEYQVEYNVLQEEISTANHHLESLNKEKRHNEHLETQLQFAQSSIAQLEKTRASQQGFITSLQTQVQTLEVTVQTLGNYISNLFESNHNMELPGDIRRIIQQVNEIEKHRRKPIFIERKIGKSMSVNSQLGVPLKVLEELNEKEAENTNTKKTTFFENTYEQLRQQKANHRPNKLVDSISKSSSKPNDIKLTEQVQNVGNDTRSSDGFDSGFGTPLSPPENQIIEEAEPTNCKLIDQVCSSIDEQAAGNNKQEVEMHPLSMCGDVNFKLIGTTQLKSLRPAHFRSLNLAARTSSVESDPGVRPTKS